MKRKREEKQVSQKGKISFVTGNQNKLKEVKLILEETGDNFPIEAVAIDLPELQGQNSEQICIEKCKIAAEKVRGPVIVEDTCLCFNAFNGHPGHYIKWWLNDVGLDGLFGLVDGKDKSAYALCTFAFSSGDPDEVPVTFKGITNGVIVSPRSNPNEKAFGWDPIFQPDGYDLTFAQMSVEEKNKISHRRKSVEKLREYLKENENKWKEDEEGGIESDEEVDSEENPRKKEKN